MFFVVLLQTCSESRQAAKAFFIQSWETKGDGWGYSDTDTHQEPTECEIREEFDEEAEHMYWKAETDVVWFQHEEEPYACEETSICNAVDPCYGFWFDERIRFAAMPRAVFEIGVTDHGTLEMPNIGIVFVLVEERPKNSGLRVLGASDQLIKSRFTRWKDEKQQEWSSPEVIERVFQ